jgi:hypothetical protein
MSGRPFSPRAGSSKGGGRATQRRDVDYRSRHLAARRGAAEGARGPGFSMLWCQARSTEPPAAPSFIIGGATGDLEETQPALAAMGTTSPISVNRRRRSCKLCKNVISELGSQRTRRLHCLSGVIVWQDGGALRLRCPGGSCYNLGNTRTATEY